MKKIVYTLIMIAAGNTVNAQGFLKKIKSKVTQAVEQPVINSAPAGMGSGQLTNTNFTDPAKFGTVIKIYSKSEVNGHMGGSTGGFDLWFPDVKVVNNQLQFQVADYYTTLYDYVNGQLVKTTGTPPDVKRYELKDGNEGQMKSTDFSQMDMANAMLKRGPHVSSGMLIGKPMQTLTFNGKLIGNFYVFQMAHNADSTAIAVLGSTIGANGIKWSLVTSGGKTQALPSMYGGQPLVSPDGKISAAFYSGTGTGGQAYLSNGTVLKTGTAFNNIVWLRNSGSIFNVEQSKPTQLWKNGELYHTFNTQVDVSTIFIGKDDKVMCWAGDHGLYFSDGTAFENGMSPHRLIIDNKEVIVFLAVNVVSGKVYLCQHDL